MSSSVKETRTLRPLRNRATASTLRLHHLMEAQHAHEVGQRIKDLRNASEQTNRSIADYVGVGERAVANWVAGMGIAWKNAKKVAELFEVDVHWLWSGKEQTPDVLGALNGSSQEQLDRIESKVDQILTNWDARWALLEADDAPGSARAEQQPARESASKDKPRSTEE